MSLQGRQIKLIREIGKILVLLIMVFFMPGSSYAQEKPSSKDKFIPKLNFVYNDLDGTKILRVTITSRIGRELIPLKDVPVMFYMLSDTGEILLENIQTIDNGEAAFTISKDLSLQKDPLGNITFFAKIDEGEDHTSTTAEINIREVNMEITFLEIDSIKTISVSAREIISVEEEIPIEDLDVYFYVPRSFSLLNIGEGWLENGECNIDFPVDLPGDSMGNLTIIVKVEDSEIFGNVEVKATKNWGKPVPPPVIVRKRGLGDTDAPLWMVYTLIILFSGVWIHYLYVLFSIYRIKKDGKKSN